jgi:hypothetical protein
MKYLCLLLILGETFCLLKSESSHEIFDSEHDSNDLLGHDDSKKTLNEELEITEKRAKDCLTRNGLNTESFLFCCGHNYSKIQDMFLARYRELQMNLAHEFNSKILNACDFDKDPCEEITHHLDKAIEENTPDVLDRVLIAKNEIENKPGINNDILELEVGKFRKNYKLFDKSRTLIAHSMIELVKYIQNEITDSGLTLKIDYKEFNPEEALRHLGIVENADDDGSISSKLNEDSKHNEDFHSNLAKEFGSLELLNFYKANGVVDPHKTDFTKLPSQIIKTLKKPKEESKEDQESEEDN